MVTNDTMLRLNRLSHRKPCLAVVSPSRVASAGLANTKQLLNDP